MQLNKFETFQVTITTRSGLKIGGNKDTLGIGETDNPVVRDPLTNFPYIPGTSIKGKTRSLLEHKFRANEVKNGQPCKCNSCIVCKLYGCGDPTKATSPARLIFRDAMLSKDSRDNLERMLPGSYVEVKMETRIDRKTGTAADRSLRNHERVPAEVDFEFDLVLRVFDEDKAEYKQFLEYLAEAFEMLEQDYLGGNGTRGYGKVEVIAADGEAHFHDFLRAKIATLP
ncbi:MAG: type III-A CRISPR-associated RAMP protein Csm3 [Calditrichaeota bacterium]|nr:type III-A CRISPR-associated RAMP protein Csm3 [Calditrichota bacterium]